MTTRRHFIAGLLASAATGAAQPVPAQPVEFFSALDPAMPGAERTVYFFPNRIYAAHSKMVRWSDRDDFAVWDHPHG